MSESTDENILASTEPEGTEDELETLSVEDLRKLLRAHLDAKKASHEVSKAPVQDYVSNSWRGIPHFECPLCQLDILDDEPRMQAHMKIHREQGENAARLDARSFITGESNPQL